MKFIIQLFVKIKKIIWDNVINPDEDEEDFVGRQW